MQGIQRQAEYYAPECAEEFERVASAQQVPTDAEIDSLGLSPRGVGIQAGMLDYRGK